MCFLLAILFTVVFFVGKHDKQEARKIIINGFRQGLKHYGLIFKKKTCPVELYRWECMDDDEVCEDCLKRSGLPAMDIAEWMKLGLPRTREAQTDCAENCRCQLRLMKSSPQ